MNRAIKFRAWEKSTEDMVSWERLIMKPDVLMDILHGDSDFELMQYTGLKDKNGKERYEGDVLAWGNDHLGPDLYEVVWYECGLRAAWLKDRKLKHIVDDTFEVIGNIYENQELLKGGENI